MLPPKQVQQFNRDVALAAAALADAAFTASPDEHPSTAFDWELCLALAGCAFEAYNMLEVEEGFPCLKMTSGNNTEVTFVSEEFLRRKFDGLVEVTVLSAGGLSAADWWPGSKSDPYAVLSIDTSAAVTSVVSQELNPQWSESFCLFASDLSSQWLTVRVMDADFGKPDDLLGTAVRALKDLADGEPRDVELPLRGPREGETGTISLRLRFLPFGGDGTLAEEATRQHMGGPVFGSPPATILSSAWRVLQKSVLDAAADAMFYPVAFIENSESDTQAWLFWNPGTRSLCLAFRGTEQDKWKDILTDLLLVPVSLDLNWPQGAPHRRQGPRCGSDAETLQSTRLELGAANAGSHHASQHMAAAAAGGSAAGEEGPESLLDDEAVWVHRGFLGAYGTVRAEVMRLLEIALAGQEGPWTLYITGHSLGGALGTLCSFDCARHTWCSTAVRPHSVHYNYGSPRVGNKAFADAYDQLVPNTWRVANAHDVVAAVPRMLGYCHVGHKAELSAEGHLDLTRNSSGALGEGAEMAVVALAAFSNLPALTEQLLAAAGVEGAAGGAAQLAKPALLSAATALASAARALAGASTEQASSAAVAAANDVQALLEEEIHAVRRLLDGSALTAHQEPVYLENLQRTIELLRCLPDCAPRTAAMRHTIPFSR